VALVHFLLKEVEWIRKVSNRLCRCEREPARIAHDLECIRELSGSVAQSMRHFLDEARRETPDAGDQEALGELVQRAVAQVQRRGVALPIAISLDPELPMLSVPVELLVAIVAVLENAVDFGSPCEPVRVEGRRRVDPDAIELCVADAGPGMAADVAHACQHRGFTTRAGDGGHGFGLYAARRILERCGGSLAVHSLPGHGTRVLLTVPLPGSARS
jgi:signal transduction histidine kinase